MKLANVLELLDPVTGDPDVLLLDAETRLEETAVPEELGPIVVIVKRVKERVP